LSLAPPIYAHTLSGRPPGEWETLGTHAAAVAGRARSFAGAFGAGEWGELLGRWHDLDKRSDAFQEYLLATADANAAENETAPGRLNHSTFSTQYPADTLPESPKCDSASGAPFSSHAKLNLNFNPRLRRGGDINGLILHILRALRK